MVPESPAMPFERIGIVGCGLIGTSLGLALHRIGVEALLQDALPEHIEQAMALGAGRTWQPEDDVDCIVVAVPPGATRSVLDAMAAAYPDATLTDVASVKSPMSQVGPTIKNRLIPGHPMAGRELSGPQAARADLFDDRLWILTPLPETDAERTTALESLVRLIGAVPITMSAAEHDEAVALVSHAPQVLASILAAQLRDARSDHVAIAGQGLRDMTRIAASNVELWTDILTANAEPIDVVLASVQADIESLRMALRGNADAVAAILREGVRGHQAIPGKHGASASTFIEIPVMVEDRPGQLAALLVAAGEADINLEDVRIEHVLGRPSGLIELSVRPEQGSALIAVLRSRGFDVRV